MAMSLHEADEMLSASRRTGREITVVSPRRYSTYNQKAKVLLENGTIGGIWMVDITWIF